MKSLHRTLAMALILAAGPVFIPLGCGGSMPEFDPAAPVHPDGDLPEDIARQVRTCAAKHRAHLGSADHSIAFDVKLDSDGEVDSVALIATTIRDDDLLVCMARALHSLTEDDLPLRSGKRSGGAGSPESRALVGNPLAGGAVALCAAAPLGCVIVLGFVVIGGVGVYIYMHTSTHPGPIHHHHPPPAEPTAMPAPESTTTAPPFTTALPMATLAPTTVPTAVPTAVPKTRRNPNQTCDDEELDRLQDEKKRLCNSGFAVTCPKDTTTPKAASILCSKILLSLKQRRACLAARWAVQDKCFGGKPDARHEKPIDEVQNGIDNCEALKLVNCAKGHPMAGL